MSQLAADQDECYRLMFYKYGVQSVQSKPCDASKQVEKQRKESKEVQQAKPEQKKKEDDDIDLFGDDDEPAPVKKAEPKPAVVAKPKKKVIAKSIVVFDVKVYEQEQDLKALSQRIYDEVNMDGLTWNKEPKILPIAFGMNKLQLGCVIEDDKVGTDDIFEKIECWEDDVQSVDIVTFNKL